jgi:hypothetical protein
MIQEFGTCQYFGLSVLLSRVACPILVIARGAETADTH